MGALQLRAWINKIFGDIINADASLKESYKETKMHFQVTVRAIYMYIYMHIQKLELLNLKHKIIKLKIHTIYVK